MSGFLGPERREEAGGEKRAAIPANTISTSHHASSVTALITVIACSQLIQQIPNVSRSASRIDEEKSLSKIVVVKEC